MAYAGKTPEEMYEAFIQTAGASSDGLDDWNQITNEEVDVVSAMTRRNELSGGTPSVREFESRWREWIGARFCITVMNGTSALYSAYFGLGVGPGDEVICPVNTWIGSISPVLLLGARPVFCDVEPETLLLDPADVERKITANTRCIVAVHLWGNVCDMDALLEIGERRGIPVVEDCSHAHGAKYRERMCGGLGIAGCWSLQGSKPVSAGEGGVLTTDNVELFERACLLGQVNRVAGIDSVSGTYDDLQPLGLGMKFRAHPLAVGIASVQLEKLEAINRNRGQFVESIEAGLSQIPGLSPCAVHNGAQRGGYYGFPILHKPAETGGTSTKELVRVLVDLGVDARFEPYPNLHELPLFRYGFDVFTRDRGPLCASSGYNGYRVGDFPIAEHAKAHTIYLSALSQPKPGAAEQILDALTQAVKSVTETVSVK